MFILFTYFCNFLCIKTAYFGQASTEYIDEDEDKEPKNLVSGMMITI